MLFPKSRTIGLAINIELYVPTTIPMNTAINQTLSRTLLTSGTTFLAVLVLFLFGGRVINDFALILLIGIVVGTYSSIFIASPIVLLFGKTKS